MIDASLNLPFAKNLFPLSTILLRLHFGIAVQDASDQRHRGRNTSRIYDVHLLKYITNQGWSRRALEYCEKRTGLALSVSATADVW